jgi:hypothetical protein
MLNLYALMNGPGPRVKRFALSNEVQEELTAYLETQEANFSESAEAEIEFDGKYKPDFGELLFINGVDDIDGLADAIRDPLSCEEINPTVEGFESIRGLFSGKVDENGAVTILLQTFDRRKVISTNGLSIFHSANVYRKIEGIGLTVDSKLSAILKDNRLTFCSFHSARQLFDLSEHYIEATDNDIVEFAALPNINVEDMPSMVALADTWIRRKFALIQQSQILTSVPLAEIKAVAAEFGIGMQFSEKEGQEAIDLPTNKAELKKLLRFLDEDYYKSPLSKANFITNSKRKVPAAAQNA